MYDTRDADFLFFILGITDEFPVVQAHTVKFIQKRKKLLQWIYSLFFVCSLGMKIKRFMLVLHCFFYRRMNQVCLKSAVFFVCLCCCYCFRTCTSLMCKLLPCAHCILMQGDAWEQTGFFPWYAVEHNGAWLCLWGPSAIGLSVCACWMVNININTVLSCYRINCDDYEGVKSQTIVVFEEQTEWVNMLWST